jgi:uncharacterized protein (TIGR01319 family)
MSAGPYQVLLATDCGSTTTKAILVVRTPAGDYRLAGRGEAPTTVEEPFNDVTIGVHNAIEEMEVITRRRLLRDGRLICPREGEDGVDVYFSTSSAGGGLQMGVTGVISGITVQSAQHAALGAGAIVVDALSIDDPREAHEQIDSLRRRRPDMILMTGGVDGGTRRHVEMLAEIIRAARPQPRFGHSFALPVIYAGNPEARELVNEMLGGIASLRFVNNVRPSIDREDLGEARHAIHELFLQHVMQQAPGYGKLMAMASADIMATPNAVGLIVRNVAEAQKRNVLAVDIGGATTDVFSVFSGQFHRTVSANYGMSYSLCNVLAECGTENILRWLPFRFKASTLRDILRNKMIRPTTIPETLEELYIEQAVSREALRLSLDHHRALASHLQGTGTTKDLSSLFAEGKKGLIDLLTLDLCIGSGGVISHAPLRAQAALILLDGFALEGVTELSVDSIFMMPQLGVMAQLAPEAARQVVENDCLVPLGTSIAPVGEAHAGRQVMEVEFSGPSGRTESHVLAAGELRRLPLETGQKARVVIKPHRAFDAGRGRGKAFEAEVAGGEAGLLLDARCRPILFSPDPDTNAANRRRDYEALGLSLD